MKQNCQNRTTRIRTATSNYYRILLFLFTKKLELILGTICIILVIGLSTIKVHCLVKLSSAKKTTTVRYTY